MTPQDPPRYRVHPSPIGDVLIVTTEDGIVTLHPFDGPLHGEIERVALQLRALPLLDDVDSDDGGAALLDAAVAQLDEYFDGDRRAFDLPLDWRLVRGFTRAALDAVCRIPYGETASYREVAAAAGNERASRAAGTACRLTPFSIVVPVHRVVRADRSLGEYGGRPDVKRYLLDLERGPSVPTAPGAAAGSRASSGKRGAEVGAAPAGAVPGARPGGYEPDF